MHLMSTGTRVLTPALMLVAVAVLVVRCPLSPYLTFAFGGAFVLQLLNRPTVKETLATFAAAVIFALTRLRIEPGANASGPYVALAFLGMAGLAVTVAPVILLSGEARSARLRDFVHRAALPFLALIAGVFVARTGRWMPITYDAYLYAFDWTFGLQAGFLAGRLFESSAWLRAIEYFAYFGLPLGLALTAARTRLYGTGRTLLIFVVAGFSGFCLYTVMPATGPAYLFPDAYPHLPPPFGEFVVTKTLLPSDVPRNAMPSLHTAWAILMLWNSRKSARWVRWTIRPFCFLTVLGTLGWGQHYLIDLVVAVPFALAVQGICTPGLALRASERGGAVVTGATLTISWILGLRTLVPLVQVPVLVTWLLAGSTVVVCIWLERKLAERAQETETTQSSPVTVVAGASD